MRRVILLLWAFAGALALVSTTLPGLAGSGAEAQTSHTETLSGVLNVRWIDPPPDSERPHEVEFVLAAGGEKTDLRVGDEEIERAGGAVALNGKRVTARAGARRASGSSPAASSPARGPPPRRSGR